MKTVTIYSILIVLLASCSYDGMSSIIGPENDKPLHKGDEEVTVDKEPGTIRLMQYNVGVFHKSGSSSLQMVSDMMKELQVDVISLNELDSVTTRTGKVDQLKAFAAQMGGWNYKYAYAMHYQGGKYGVGAAASPELNYVAGRNIHLPKVSGGEERALAVMEFDNFIFAATHLDFGAAQLTQVTTINSFFDSVYGDTDKPIFLCGDFNSTPGSDTIKEVLKTWTMISVEDKTASAISPTKCIDFIFMRKNGANVKIVKSMVCKKFSSGDVTIASDHLPVFTDIILQ